jgi:RNA polymerase sigma-70 factor (TIGR02943 family)
MTTLNELNDHLQELRPRLIAFCQLQTDSRDLAEDLVQDALIAAVERLDSFEGRSRLDTWIFGILKFKLIDFVRKRAKERTLFHNDSEEIDLDNYFDGGEHWQPEATPESWSTPEDLHFKSQFWQVFDFCLLHLPENTAKVFALRELMEMDTGDICECLSITEQNCWTILHRARLKLRGCVEQGWFMKEGDQ